MYEKASTLVAIAALAFTGLVGNTAAVASEHSTVEVTPSEASFSEVTVRPATADDFPAEPAIGHTKTVKTANGTTEVYQATATCRMSYSTSAPYKGGNRAVARVSTSRSSGCSGSMSVTAYLIQGYGISSYTASRNGATVYPGSTVGFTLTSAICKYGFNRTWYSAIGAGSGGFAAESAKVTLPCEV